MNKQPQWDAKELHDLDDKVFNLWGELLLEEETKRLQMEVVSERGTPEEAERDAFFARHQKQHLALIQQHTKRNKRLHVLHVLLPRAARAAAVVIAVLTLLSGVALASSSTLRVQVMKLLAISTPEYTELKLVPDEDVSFDVPADWRGTHYLSYVPEGLELVKLDVFVDGGIADYRQKNGENLRITFLESGDDGVTNVDTENAELRQLTLGHHPATMVLKKDSIIIYWSDGYHSFILITKGFDADTALKIAQNVRPVVNTKK